MVRVSLKEAYDDRSVIKKIADLEAKKQDKLTAGQGVIIDGTTISVDTSDLATKVELTDETARLDQKIDDVDAKIPPLASKAELSNETARLDAKIDNVDAKIPPLASKEELNAQAARLDAKIDSGDRDLSSRIDASNVNIKTNEDAILTIEDELGSDALPGTIYYRIAKVEGEVITLKPLVNDSIKKVDVEGDASTVYHSALHNSGVVERDVLPVASDTKAGVMSASMYVGFNGSIQNLQARMAVLEGVGITYQLTGLPDSPSDAQITAAFREQYPNVPLSAGIRAADYDKAKIWQYSGTSWIQLTSINIDKATSTALGVVKGSETSTTNEGKIFVEVDGSMTVIGWDTLKALATAAKQSVDNLEPRVTQQSAKIDALEGDVAANAADITALQGTSANHESRISSLETTSADLRTRMGTAETDIDTLQASDAQQTSKISALEADMNNVKPRVGQLESDVGTLGTKVDQHTQSISGLSTDVNGLKTSKQDKLIAGDGITIASDGKTISANPSKPIVRVVSGKDEMLNELKKFLSQGEIGDTYDMIFGMGNVGAEVYRPPVEKSFFRFGVVDDYFFLEPATALRIVDRRESGNVTYVTASCIGNLRYYPPEGSMQDENGVIYLTTGNLTQFRFNVCRFTNLRSVATGSLTGNIIIGVSPYEDLKDPKAIVNYEPKP